MNSFKNGNSIIIKSQKSEQNKKYNEKNLKKIINIKVKNKNKNMIIKQKEITNIKLKNKKSFCFISRNKLFSENKYNHIFYCPINKIDNINYQSNNINNFYFINGTNTNLNKNLKMNQKILKKQLTESDVKNINYQQFILPISYFENAYINDNVNINENIAKSVSKSKEKRALQYYQITKKNKISKSYNKKSNLEKKESYNKENDTKIIMDGDSEISNDNEKNITPKKNKDNVKINPIKLLGDFKKEYNTFYEHTKNKSKVTGYKL
jgi:hypothetical protein